MDWNKSKTIFIIAFLIINSFLFLVVYNDDFSGNNYEAFDDNFIDNISNKLEKNNIKITCEIPEKLYSLPLLEVEYKYIIPNNVLIENFLGNNIKADENIFYYENENNEKLQIENNKLLIYTKRQPLKSDTYDNKKIENEINEFFIKKNISLENYKKTSEYINDGILNIKYNQTYNEFCIENIFIKLYIDAKGIYKIEIQQAENIIAKEGKIDMTSAPEALFILLLDKNNEEKTIKNIELCYFTKEDETWSRVSKTNADPTWKVIFEDNTYKYLEEKE